MNMLSSFISAMQAFDSAFEFNKMKKIIKSYKNQNQGKFRKCEKQINNIFKKIFIKVALK